MTGPVGSRDFIISSDILAVVSCQTPTDLLVALLLGEEAALELAVDLGDGVVGAIEAARLVLRDLDVEQTDGHATDGSRTRSRRS